MQKNHLQSLQVKMMQRIIKIMLHIVELVPGLNKFNSEASVLAIKCTLLTDQLDSKK